MDDMAICPLCGFDLRNSPLPEEVDTSIDALLLSMAETGLLPAPLSEFVTVRDAFDAIWVFAQLMLRSGSSEIWSHLPTDARGLLLRQSRGTNTVEALNVRLRRLVIEQAYWLLCDWPDRFLGVVRHASLTRVHFLATASVAPRWLNAIVDQELTVRRRGITPAQVTEAVEELTIEGIKVSKSAVRTRLGVSESAAVNNALSRREHARWDELMVLLHKFEDKLKRSPESRDQRRTLSRDYLVFLLSVLSHSQLEQVCACSIVDVSNIVEDLSWVDVGKVDAWQLLSYRARTLNAEYASNVRPALLKEGGGGAAPWFIGRLGEPLTGHTVRDRIAKMMSTGFTDDLWHSADVFLHVLGNPQLGRRAKQRAGLVLSTWNPRVAESP